MLKHMTPAIRGNASEQVAKWFGREPNAPAVPPVVADAPPTG